MKATAFAASLSAFTVFAGAAIAEEKETVQVEEAAKQMMDVCVAAKGDKRRAEQKLGPLSGFDRIQSTTQQSVAVHRTKDISFLLIMQDRDLSCVMNFEPTGDPVKSFYGFRNLIAAELDLSEDDFSEDGTTLVYRSDDMEVMIAWASGISTSVIFQ